MINFLLFTPSRRIEIVKDNRPVNISPVDLLKFGFPVTAISSILHRMTGVLLFLSVPICLWALQKSLTPEGFVEMSTIMACWVSKLIAWAILSMLAYHIVAGVRHLLMDAGVGEELESGRRGSYIVIILGVLMAIIIGVRIW